MAKRATKSSKGKSTKASKGAATKMETLAGAARVASESAHAPYSDFQVGAAILDEHGNAFLGCNVENASYGLTICAERNAVFQLVAAGSKAVRAVAIYTPTKTPTPPCGACRQVLAEFAGPDVPVLSTCAGKGRLESTVGALLPHTFSL
jgi:cytidine deaminase